MEAANSEMITIPGCWDFEYEYFAGASASRFFIELRDNRRIMGTRCPECHRVLVPARSFCDACFVATSEWVEVENRGRVDMFTILTATFPGLPEPPLAIVYVTLDGADTAIVNTLTGLDLSDLDAAVSTLMTEPEVDVIFAEQAQGRITDFQFRLAA